MDNAGLDTKNLLVPGFCIKTDNIENAAILLQEDLDEYDEKRMIVIYQLYYNNCYFTALEVGSKSKVQVRDRSDNLYHIQGRLELADHVNVSVPLLRTGSAGGLQEGYSLPPAQVSEKMLQQQRPADHPNGGQLLRDVRRYPG
jgi:hypothetical protein